MEQYFIIIFRRIDEMDLQFEVQTCEDKLIVNRDILKSKDRDFKDIAFDCYDNLKSTILIAWNDGPATMDDLFKSDFKKQLAKAKDKDVDFSADVDSLGNVMSRFDLKYIIDPEVVYDKYRRIALENTINKFQLFMEIEFNNYQINLFNEESLFDNLNGFPQWCYLKYLVEINKEKQQMPNIVERHDSNGYIDSERVKRGLLFGSLADGACVYFDLEDDFSIWEYWLDDGSIGKIADNFDEILEYGKIIDFE